MGWTDRALRRTLLLGAQLAQGAWTMTRKAIDVVTTIGIDIGKNTFHLIGLDAEGIARAARALAGGTGPRER